MSVVALLKGAATVMGGFMPGQVVLSLAAVADTDANEAAAGQICR
jgi:hypothetical protein